MSNTDLIPKDKKQAITQAMLDLNYSATEIAEELNIHRSTVYRYKDKPLSEDLRHFATEIKTLFSIKQSQILSKLLKKIDEEVDDTYDMRALVSAFNIISKHTKSLHQIHKEALSDKRYDKIMGGFGS
jgi:predicted DNA-binding protein YlxM (UPF0122 family)